MWSTHQRIDKDTLLHCKTMHYFLYLSHCWLLQFAERLSPVVSQHFKSHFWRSHFKQKPAIQQPHNWYFQRTERRCPVKTVSTLHRCKSRMHCNQLIVCVSDGQTAYAIDWSRNFSDCSRTRRSYSARFWLQPTTNQNTCIFHTATMTPVQRMSRVWLPTITLSCDNSLIEFFRHLVDCPDLQYAAQIFWRCYHLINNEIIRSILPKFQAQTGQTDRHRQIRLNTLPHCIRRWQKNCKRIFTKFLRRPWNNKQPIRFCGTVSYTHLTLPTILRV